MKLIKSKSELVLQQGGIEGIYKQIEFCGRTCYKSEDKITEDSAKSFVKRMIKSNHTAMLEHGTVYLMVHTIAPEDWDKKIGRHTRLTIDDCRDDLRTNPTYDDSGEENWWAEEAGHKAHVMAVKYADNPYSKVKIVLTQHELNTKDGIILTPTGDMPIITKGAGKVTSVFNTILITTNLRVLVENNWLDDLQYLCSPTEFHEKRYTMRFTCSRAIAQELTRHSVFSFLMESQRYINYSKERHGGELTLIIPDRSAWERTETSMGYAYWNMLRLLDDIELVYMEAIKEGVKPEIARDILPNITKTELIMTGFASDWRFFFDLRYYGETGKPHPDMELLASKARGEFMKAGLWDNIMACPTKFDKDDPEGKD